MTVKAMIKNLRRESSKVGCIFAINYNNYPLHTVAIIPDHPFTMDRFLNTQVCDGVFVFVDPKDMDKNAKHSRYYKALADLQERFDNSKDLLSIRAEKLSERPEGSKQDYFNILMETIR